MTFSQVPAVARVHDPDGNRGTLVENPVAS